MEGNWILNAYWIALIVGIGYTIVSFILGGIGGHAHFEGGDMGDAGQGGHMDVGDSGQLIFGPFSPLVIAFFLTCFGATGIVLTSLKGLHLLSLPFAVVSGFVLAWVLILVFNRFLGGMQSSSEVKVYALVGTEGEVTVEIPPSGIGEIAYVAMGGRYVAPARSEEPVAIPRFAAVRITRLVGNMFYVIPILEERLRQMDATEEDKRDE